GSVRSGAGLSGDADLTSMWVARGAGTASAEIGIAVATQLQKILNAPAAGANMKVNADLRPEGRNGPLARTREAWNAYYRRDAMTWEKQALLRARPVVASQELAGQLRQDMDR